MNRRHFLLAAPTAAMAVHAAGANDRIRIAVIGVGVRNLLGEALQLHKDANVEVAAVCDTWRIQREKAAAQTEKASGQTPKQVIHYQDVLADSSIDGVLISTPDHQHCRMLAAAIRAGKDVYVEKPLAMDMKELIMAVDTVKKSDRVVQVGTQVRSWAPSVAGKAFVASGGLGKIFKIEQSRNNFRPYWHSTGARKAEQADVDWKAFLMHRKFRPWDADQYAAWYGYREFSRGPHTGFMAHFVDLVHYITGAPYPTRATALGGIYRWKDARTAPDSIEVALEYPEQGFLARYSTTFGTGNNNFMKFFGTRGVMDATKWNAPWTISGEGLPDADRIPAGATIPPVESTHHMRNWFDCMRSRKTPAAPIDAGYSHAVACILADEAFARGRRMVYQPSSRAIKEG